VAPADEAVGAVPGSPVRTADLRGMAGWEAITLASASRYRSWPARTPVGGDHAGSGVAFEAIPICRFDNAEQRACCYPASVRDGDCCGWVDRAG
jgi:hypothetical protein